MQAVGPLRITSSASMRWSYFEARSLQPDPITRKRRQQQMNNNQFQRNNGVTLVRNMFAGALVVTCASAFAMHASAQTVTPPPTPTQITPPVGNTAFLVGHAFGSQGYTCLPDKNTGAPSWTVNNA